MEKSKMKSVLIITYYWPPGGGPGVQRTLFFAKHLRKFGWEPIIYTTVDAEYPALDDSLDEHIPEGITVLRKKPMEPHTFYKVLSGYKPTHSLKPKLVTEKGKRPLIHKLSVWIRGNLFIPDAKVLWISPSVRMLSKFLKDNPVDAIITSSPPQSIQMIGLRLKQKHNLPWIADFRDPWTKISTFEYLRLTYLARQKHERLEKKVLSSADHIVTVSKKWEQDFIDLGAKDISIVTNGYEPIDNYEPTTPNQQQFIISYFGSISSERNPKEFWNAIKKLVEKKSIDEKKMVIRLIGAIHQDVIDTIHDLSLTPFLELKEYIPHSELLNYYNDTSLLLLIGIPNDSGVLPGKLFEYMYHKKPIFSVGTERSEINRVIEETNSGLTAVFGGSDMFKKLESFYQLYQKNELKSQSYNTERYSREHTTEKMANILDEVIRQK